MDKHGIGTDATHAEHIETVKNRQYIGVTNNDKLVPGTVMPHGEGIFMNDVSHLAECQVLTVF
jgi:DNA topoisomerase IA